MPLAEHDLARFRITQYHSVSIHVPLAEHDQGTTNLTIVTDVSIHVPLAEHDLGRFAHMQRDRVSIHVPLAEHDISNLLKLYSCISFNSRAPRGARLADLVHSVECTGFQFTCPSRSTTFLSLK